MDFLLCYEVVMYQGPLILGLYLGYCPCWKALIFHILAGETTVLVSSRPDTNSLFMDHPFSWQPRWDRNRVIHYSGGDVVAVSSNRKIQLLDVLQAKEIPVQFRGHTGSVRALFVCEAENFLLSGSYDLSIR